MAFIDQGEFEAMKTLSGWEAARCDEHSFGGLNKLLACVVKLYGFWLSIAYIARRRHPYIESLPTPWYAIDAQFLNT